MSWSTQGSVPFPLTRFNCPGQMKNRIEMYNDIVPATPLDRDQAQISRISRDDLGALFREICPSMQPSNARLAHGCMVWRMTLVRG